MRVLFTVLLIGVAGIAIAQNRAAQVVNSPSQRIKLEFRLNAGVPYYQISRDGKPVLNASRLGFLLKDGTSLAKGFSVLDARTRSFDETWTQPWGEVKDIRNHYNALAISLENASKQKLNIEFRVFDDGVGFRYQIPVQNGTSEFVIKDELTEFALANEMSGWWIPAYGKEMDSEYLFTKSPVNKLTEKVHTPLTLESKGLFVSIHEAALIDYAAMALQHSGKGVLKCDLIPWANGDRVVAKAPLSTPWRTIQIADKPGDLITSYLILNLNEPNKLDDVSWIQPGKYNGMWWGMHIKTHTWEAGPNHGATTENMKKLIDFAADHKLSATLAEGWNLGWEGDWTKSGNFNFTTPYPDYDLGEISTYAKQRNIGLIAHHETGGNVDNYERQIEDAFKLCQQYDIHRLKTGYVNMRPAGEYHQGQYMVRHYQKVLELAASYKIMLDVHEPIKDTGLRRTYPNMMTREGGRGTEYEAWSTGNPPSHTTIIPFTRCLGGPFDYTPGIFDIQFKTEGTFRVHTTLAKQLALYVVIYSPMHMAADLPENYEGKPAFKFIEDVPTDWEATKVLDATIGEFIVTARKDRKSEDWFLGAITNESERAIDLKLNFLAPGKKYAAQIYRDGESANMEANPLAIQITNQEVDNSQSLKLWLAPGGGTAIRFKAIN
ncbi:glycoside hydrolase family 97 protein [Chryseolinea sp. T2]|uniref:glycoside hydrolase family 97 protein n=1 Tax=Chryseolinea sp. T2 TaxID=3129255 RepID=UPI0030774A45